MLSRATVAGRSASRGITASASDGSSRSPWRFTQIQKILHIQPKTLTARLKELVEFGLVTRKSYNEIPPRVDYELTQKGRDVTKIFEVLGHWSEKNKSTFLEKRRQ